MGDVDEKAGVLRVRRSWDAREGEIDPKSSAGVRDIPILAPSSPSSLHKAQRAPGSRDPEGLVVGASRRGACEQHRTPPTLRKSIHRRGLKHVTPHEARHSFASYSAASGIGIKDLTVILGHSSVTVSLARYGHFIEAGKAQTAAQINAWFAAAAT